MAIEETISKISEKLVSFRNDLNQFFVSKLNNFKFDEVRDKIIRFYDTEFTKISKRVDYSAKLLNSPIYVGLLGRYSHGKTALLNSMFNIREDYRLPEGEGVVTSKITRVEFKSGITGPKCFEILRDGNSNPLDVYSLKENVRGNSSRKF